MTDVRSTLDTVWDRLRKARIVDDRATVEYIAALLINGKQWPFDENQKPEKPGVHYNSDDIDLKNLLLTAASQINEKNQERGIADLFNRQVLFYSSKYKGEGVYPTPRHIVDFMMNLLDVKPEHDFADISCGSGGFLVRRYQQQQTSKKKMAPGVLGRTIGVDIAPEWTRLAHTNLVLNAIPADKAQIYTGDVLRLCGPAGDLEDTKFDRIVLSPPLYTPIQIQFLDTDLFSLMGMMYSNTDALNSDTLLTYLMHAKLKQNGKGISIVSTITVTRHSREAQALRKLLVEANEVLAVIKLNNAALAPYTKEQAYILMLHKHVQNFTWFLHIERDGYHASLYRDIIQQPDITPEWNDMPFIQQVVHLTKNTSGWRTSKQNEVITYRLVRSENIFAGIIIKVQENARIIHILYEQGLIIEVSHNRQIERLNIAFPIQLTNNLERKTVFRNGKPGQMLAISADGRLLGVTISTEEIIRHQNDLLPETYFNMHLVDRDAFGDIQPIGDILESAILETDPALVEIENVAPQNETVESLQETMTDNPVILSQVPQIAMLPDIEPILGAKQQAIWQSIKHRYSTEQYALPFMAYELTHEFALQDVAATLRLLERFGLIVCVQMRDDDGSSPYYYYRRVTNTDVLDNGRSIEKIPRQEEHI